MFLLVTKDHAYFPKNVIFDLDDQLGDSECGYWEKKPQNQIEPSKYYQIIIFHIYKKVFLFFYLIEQLPLDDMEAEFFKQITKAEEKTEKVNRTNLKLSEVEQKFLVFQSKFFIPFGTKSEIMSKIM